MSQTSVVRFTVEGKNLWELNNQAYANLQSLCGDLVDQEVEYKLDISPLAEAYGDPLVKLWRASVVATISTAPVKYIFNAWAHSVKKGAKGE